jgi:8-oxo-dGTP pyrophosphatase MutT (NUDIX family)
MAEAQAAVAIVHAPRNEKCRDELREESVLLIRRTERDGDPWSGHWSFPGGRRDPTDEDLVETALRELAEECGIVLGRECLEACLPATMAGRRVGRVMIVAPFLFRAVAELATRLDPEEAAESLWIPLAWLRDPSRHCLTPVPGLPRERIFPGIALNGMPLWGFTYRVITEWLELHPRSDPPERAGFQTAQFLLEFLLAHGMELRYGWKAEREEPGPKEIPGSPLDTPPIVVAGVKGEIPVAAVLARLALPGDRIPAVNSLEILPDSLRVVGLGLEEYVIRAE